MVDWVLFLIIIILLVALIVAQLIFTIFSAEIKDLLSRFRIKRKRTSSNVKFLIDFFNNLASSLARMSADRVGALIIIENKDNLNPYINIGNKVDSAFFPEFVTNIFYNHKSALHDGAMIIRDWRIVSLSSYLPMTKKVVSVEYGARHRAALGICEKYDCFAFVVSETNGNITVAHLDEFKKLSTSPEKLAIQITKMFVDHGVFGDKKNYRKLEYLVSKINEFNSPTNTDSSKTLSVS